MAIRWHGALMIFGWMGCTTLGILMARFSRDHFPNHTIIGMKVWFQMHRIWMILGWAAMVASYIIIFIHFGGWSGTSFHTVGGLIAGLLATAQGMNSYLRPAPDSPKRWVFDYGHWFVGNAAHCLARKYFELLIFFKLRNFCLDQWPTSSSRVCVEVRASTGWLSHTYSSTLSLVISSRRSKSECCRWLVASIVCLLFTSGSLSSSWSCSCLFR